MDQQIEVDMKDFLKDFYIQIKNKYKYDKENILDNKWFYEFVSAKYKYISQSQIKHIWEKYINYILFLIFNPPCCISCKYRKHCDRPMCNLNHENIKCESYDVDIDISDIRYLKMIKSIDDIKNKLNIQNTKKYFNNSYNFELYNLLINHIIINNQECVIFDTNWEFKGTHGHLKRIHGLDLIFAIYFDKYGIGRITNVGLTLVDMCNGKSFELKILKILNGETCDD